MKRIFLFVLTNLAVMLVLSVVASLLGVNRFLTSNGLNLGALLGFAMIMGFGGAFISLLMSKSMAKWSTGAQVITQPQSADEAWIVDTVRRLSEKAGIGMPEVAIYEGEPNAFATGAFRDSALVAVSTGLLQGMTREEVEAVLGHEIGHVANGDMVTLTLIQGVVNAFVLFFSRIAAIILVNALSSRDDREDSRPSYFLYSMTDMIFRMIFGILGAIIVAWFSRWREFRADSGGARFAGREKMRAALQRLRSYQESVDTSHPSMQAFKISSGSSGFLRLFSTHPPLDERIQRLDSLRG